MSDRRSADPSTGGGGEEGGVAYHLHLCPRQRRQGEKRLGFRVERFAIEWHLISRWTDCSSTPEHLVLNIFWGRNVTAEHSVQTFLANPTVWHFVPWLHFIHRYLTSISPLKIVTFRPIVTFRHFVTLHPDCILSPFFPFCDILSLFYTCLTLWHLVHTFGVTVRQNRNLPTHGSVCRVP
jgi:hypothetical protein